MDIILVSGRLARARTVRVGRLQFALMALALLVLVAFAAAGALQLLTIGRVAGPAAAVSGASAAVQPEGAATATGQAALPDDHPRLRALAARVAELQGKVVQLANLGQKLSRAAGIKQAGLGNFAPVPGGQGGAYIPLTQAGSNLDELSATLALLARQVERGDDHFAVLDGILSGQGGRGRARSVLAPVSDAGQSSGFGWREDPFSGLMAFHEGIDFPAEAGTPILAAAGGVVITSGVHPQYGNIVEIDHGNHFITRYGHASERLVQVGEVVRRGARIGTVGNSGRSTGPHLHFEVRVHGVAQDPARYLRPPG